MPKFAANFSTESKVIAKLQHNKVESKRKTNLEQSAVPTTNFNIKCKAHG